MNNLESFEDFKKRIWLLPPDQQLLELNRRDALENMNLHIICPHCGSSGKKSDISLHNKGEMFFCLECHASYKTNNPNGEHFLNAEFHERICF